jgi:hypothetical protein
LFSFLWALFFSFVKILELLFVWSLCMLKIKQEWLRPAINGHKHSNIQNFKQTVILGQNWNLPSIKLSRVNCFDYLYFLYFTCLCWLKIEISQNSSLTQLNTKLISSLIKDPYMFEVLNVRMCECLCQWIAGLRTTYVVAAVCFYYHFALITWWKEVRSCSKTAQET